MPSDSSKDYYYIIRNTSNTEAVLIEYGFLESGGDDVSQLKNDWQSLAEAVVKAVTEYIGLPYYAEGDEYYTVQKGDSLWSIAKKFNTTVDKLKSINNLSSNLLSIGQRLKIKEGTSSIGKTYYTVQKGDTLYAIAKQFNTTVSELMTLNNLTSSTLPIGQKLKVPESKEKEIYTVQSGDTIYSIARKFNTTVSALNEANNLSTSVLSIGQKLIIP